MHPTHQNDRADKGNVCEEVTGLGKASCSGLKLAGVGVQEVRVHEQTKRRPSDEEGRDQAPYFGQGAIREELVRQERDVVWADEVHVHWHGESNSDGRESPADQYQKRVLGRGGA